MRYLLYILIFSLPLFFLPLTLDTLEINKQTLFLILTFSAAILWIANMFRQKRFSFRSGWINILPIFYLVAVVVSSFFSNAPFVSWVGGATQEYTSALTTFGLAVLFYLVVNVLSEKHNTIYFLLLSSGILVAILAIASLFTNNQTFNTIGTINAAGIYLIVMSIFASSIFLSENKRSLSPNVILRLRAEGSPWFFLLIPILTFVFLLIVDYWLLWFLFVLGHVLLIAYLMFRSGELARDFRSIVPILFLVLALPFWIWIQSPISISVPAEVTPNTQSSLIVARKTLEKFSPWFGSGPGTYVFDFATFHTAEINKTEFYNTRFDRASSFYLTLLPTVGYVGFISFAIFLLALGCRALFHPSTKSAMFVPWLTLLIAAGFYPFNLTLVFLLFLFSGLLASQMAKQPAEKMRHPMFAKLILSVVLTVGSIGFLVGIFFAGQRYVAEMTFAKAVRSDREEMPLSEVVKSLDTAATLNRFDDRFYRVLSEALLLHAKEKITADDDPQFVQSLVSASVNMAVRATELSSRQTSNWLALGFVYRELIGAVPDASKFAIDAHKKATELEPLNPSVWNELGITFAATKDQDESAQKMFEKAIELKSNFAPAHYQLAKLFDRQGKLDEAIGKMESVAKYNSKDVGVAFELGQMYLRRNGVDDLERAKNAFSYAVSLAPSYSNARWFLATVFEKEGNLQAAIEQIEEVLKLNPENEIVKSRLDSLLKGKLSSSVPEEITGR